jgi:hypothetical protein
MRMGSRLRRLEAGRVRTDTYRRCGGQHIADLAALMERR